MMKQIPGTPPDWFKNFIQESMVGNMPSLDKMVAGVNKYADQIDNLQAEMNKNMEDASALPVMIKPNK